MGPGVLDSEQKRCRASRGLRASRMGWRSGMFARPWHQPMTPTRCCPALKEDDRANTPCAPSKWASPGTCRRSPHRAMDSTHQVNRMHQHEAKSGLLHAPWAGADEVVILAPAEAAQATVSATRTQWYGICGVKRFGLRSRSCGGVRIMSISTPPRRGRCTERNDYFSL
jgi:hypothetical protein